MNTRFGTPNSDSGILRYCSTSSETAVHLPPETLFDFNRNPCSASPKYAIRTIRRKLLCPGCGHIEQLPMPSLPIERGIA
ncbi:hypothetical protein FHX58_007728, partial [Paraburkholderia tropica]|nr:hypothetical protein [Paraburkholderia tropica]